MNLVTKFHNSARYVIEGSFDLSAGAAVQNITDGVETKTVRGEGMSVAKNGTGTYDVTVKLASSLDGKPVFQPVELLYGNANFIGTTLATTLDARIKSVALDTSGNLVISVITAQTTGAAADTTGAITVAFQVIVATQRMGRVI